MQFFTVVAITISTLIEGTQARLKLQHTRDSLDAGHNQCENKAYDKQCGNNWDYRSYPTDQQDRADAIVEMFRFGWDGYYEYAFPHDDLFPKNNSFSDSRNGWGLTAIDALDTAIIMEQKDIVQVILDFIPTVDFTKNNSPKPVSTSLFETNIRYLGGMLAAYDLLKGPFSHLGFEDSKVDALLSQSVILADAIKFAFDTPTGIPKNSIFIDNQTFTESSRMQNGEFSAGLAEIGTLVLEWQRLSDLTGNPEYGNLVQKAESYWFNAPEIYPGLTGSNFSVTTGDIIDNYGGWASGNDSAYEYLIKMYVYDPERYGNYSERWQSAANSTIAHLLSSPGSRPDLVMAGVFEGDIIIPYSEQLACFIGGNFLLGSTVLKNDEYLKHGLLFSEFCANGYRYPASGIGPVFYSWDEELLASNFSNQTDFYNEAGYFIPSNTALGNGQTPEAVESWYYAYQTTGDQYWRDVAWAYTLAQNETTRVGSGFVSIRNVLEADGGGNNNFMQSFMLAEVLKYHFMIQSPKDGIWNVQHGENKTNEFVYNTEAHPIRVVAKNPV